jgi:ABC-type polysaccharide/polyol phosphate transport system ATPase subunit
MQPTAPSRQTGASEQSRRAPAPGVRPPIRLTHVHKSFRLPHQQVHTLKERALHPFAARRFDLLRAVDDVSVEVGQGEFFGIVGRNGSGKSTLLKCLAGIYGIDSGGLEVEGRLAPFIELGVGFNPELTARDNAIINAIMLGLTRRQALERFDEIVAFAELEEFMDLRLKNYSSGMHVRLAFSVAVQVDADILLIDEVLAVGDASFQQKCFDQFTRLKREGRTIVFVTHDMSAVERFCDRAMLMEHGRVVEIGSPQAIARRYNELNFRRVRESDPIAQQLSEARRRGAAQVVSARFESPDGAILVSARQGEPLVVRMEVAFHEDTDEPIFAIALRNELNTVVFATSTWAQERSTGRFAAGESATVSFRFENWLGVGRHWLDATVAREGLGADVFDHHADSSLIVTATRPGGGVVDLPHEIEISRG